MSLASAWEDYFRQSSPGYAQAQDQAAAVAARQASGPAPNVPYSALAADTNAFMTGQAKAPYVANLPDYESMVAQRSGNIGAELKGEVPQDVITQILQQAAERGIATGSPGSPNANASMLRALGLTSLGMQQQGSKDLSQSIADTPVSPLFSPASLFVPTTLASMGLNAAQAGLRTGSGGGGATGGSSIRLPGGTLGGSYRNTPASWEQSYGQPMVTGGSGAPMIGSNGLFNSSTFDNGMWTGGSSGGGTSYMGAADSYDNPFAPINQPAGYDFNEQYTGQNFMDELYSDFSNVDFGSDYSPFGSP